VKMDGAEFLTAEARSAWSESWGERLR
jgi:hypothetical protein